MLKKEILRAFNRMAKHCDCRPVVSRRVVQREVVVTHEPVVVVEEVCGGEGTYPVEELVVMVEEPVVSVLEV